jgi:phage-related minor tail protein
MTMSMVQESSVVFSVQQLLDEEESRQKAESVAREEQRQREVEARRAAFAAEAARAELLAQQARDEERRQQSDHEAALLKARLLAESEIALARQQQETERDVALRRQIIVPDSAPKPTQPRILVAALATLLAGAVAIWGLVILPGERHAERQYTQLLDQRAADQEQAVRRESDLRAQLRRLESELEKAHAIVREPPRPDVHVAQKPPTNFIKPASRPPHTVCKCLAADPLCDCSP